MLLGYSFEPRPYSSAWAQMQSWTKMLRKMYLVCLILEYFCLKRGSLKILPPPPQKEKQC